MKHLWIVLGQVPHCPAGWATAILECSYNEWVYLTFNSVWASDSCQVESTSMPGPKFFFFSRSTPHCNKTINVNQLACQWFLCSGWLGTCMHKESHTYASTHTYTHTHKHTHKGFADTWLLTNCLHTSLGANALSQIIRHFSHREHLHNSLPVGAALKVSFC